MNYRFGDIVLLKFPHSDGLNFSKRPALILADTGDGDIIVCRITSQLYNSQFDLLIKPSSANGLPLESYIRIHKIATIEKLKIEKRIGILDIEIKGKARLLFGKLI